MKWLVYFLFFILYVLVTFFGIGPVLLADGSDRERILTLLVVLVVYAVLTLTLRLIMKKMK